MGSPRIRGEYNATSRSPSYPPGSPPHARGIRPLAHSFYLLTGITPACAGNTLNTFLPQGRSWDHPRMRGEYIMLRQNKQHKMGSPPHARGIPNITALCRICFGITPACAGNTNWIFCLRQPTRDHPRMRGEYGAVRSCSTTTRGSPPHARGIRKARTDRKRRRGITPACAGNTMTLFPTYCELGDHPRMRGEYGNCTLTVNGYEGSPPHARGIQKHRVQPSKKGGITPACAGNTGSVSCSASSFWDHPRMRGEYTSSPFTKIAGTGSPPHARGIQTTPEALAR